MQDANADPHNTQTLRSTQQSLSTPAQAAPFSSARRKTKHTFEPDTIHQSMPTLTQTHAHTRSTEIATHPAPCHRRPAEHWSWCPFS